MNLAHSHLALLKIAGAGNLRGKLHLSKKGWLTLQVPNALGHGLFAALQAPGAEMPENYNAHISVMRPEEIERIGGPERITERGKDFSYTLQDITAFNPAGWPEMDRCWVVRVQSKDLETLRQTYGLSPLPTHPANGNSMAFHITFAVRRAGVRDANDIAKHGADLEKVTTISNKTRLQKAGNLQKLPAFCNKTKHATNAEKRTKTRNGPEWEVDRSGKRPDAEEVSDLPAVLWHLAPRRVADKIGRTGLRARSSRWGEAPRRDVANRVYFVRERAQALAQMLDILRDEDRRLGGKKRPDEYALFSVNRANLPNVKFYKDPEWPESSVFAAERIPAAAVSRQGDEIAKQGAASEDEFFKSPPNKEGRKCPGCGRLFKECEPLPDVEMCEACERYGASKDKQANDNKPGQAPRFHVSGAILGVLGDAAKEYDLEHTETLAGNPWKAIVRTRKPLTAQQLFRFHQQHAVDADQTGVPYYFLIRNATAPGSVGVWYSDDPLPMPLNTPAQFAAAQRVGIAKGLKPEHVNFIEAPPSDAAFAGAVEEKEAQADIDAALLAWLRAGPEKQAASTQVDEQAFRRWYAEKAKQLGLHADPDDPRHHYDYRSAFAAGAEPDSDKHWPSRFKHPDHPNRFVDGMDTISGEKQAEATIGQQVYQAARRVTEPTEAQAEVGNYRKGHVRIHGLPVTIETAKGMTRSGTSKAGKTWSVTMPAHYGYIRGTTDKDADHMDVFIGPTPESELVYVVDQIDPATKMFDEHKCILGTTSLAEAKQLYTDSYESGWQGMGKVTPLTIHQFKAWLAEGKQHRPISTQVIQVKAAADNADEAKPGILIVQRTMTIRFIGPQGQPRDADGQFAEKPPLPKSIASILRKLRMPMIEAFLEKDDGRTAEEADQRGDDKD